MYCTKCGKEISDDSKFCCYCGSEQRPMVDMTAKPEVKPRKQKPKINIDFKNKKVMIGIITIAIILVCIVIRPMVKERSIENTIDLLMEAFNEMDAEKMLDTMSEDQVNYLIKNTSGGREEYIKEGNQYLLEFKKELQKHVGGGYSLDDISLDYEITSTRDLTEKELDQLNETLQEENINPVNEAKQLTISITLKAGTSEVQSYNNVDLQFMKVKNKWCLTSVDGIEDM